ncbi:DUF2141 domain-containing protein, partial [Paenibacillus elgii]|nr:DUF2141 domain-containing protein [Paenibacillus elgii]
SMTVCVPLPEAGVYGIAVRHDVNGNGKTDISKGWRRHVEQSRHQHLQPWQAELQEDRLFGRRCAADHLYHDEIYVTPMASVALLLNPRSTGNRSQLPRVREFCAAHPDIFHYEVEDVEQIGEAIRTIAMVSPRVVAINGGDGTVQAALTELYF